jgi:hypothetical protein
MSTLRTSAPFAAALGAAVSFWAGPASTQAPAAISIVCQTADYRRLAEHLAARFGERPVAHGAATDSADSGGVATVVFASRGGATWTLVHLWPDGTACVAASGEHWEAAAPAVRGEES